MVPVRVHPTDSTRQRQNIAPDIDTAPLRRISLGSGTMTYQMIEMSLENRGRGGKWSLDSAYVCG